VALATALAPLHAVAGLVARDVATYQAVLGQRDAAAMDELAGETGRHAERQEGGAAELSGARSPST